jgi:hypothetical protein
MSGIFGIKLLCLGVEQRPAWKSAFTVSNSLLDGLYRATRLKKIWLRVGLLLLQIATGDLDIASSVSSRRPKFPFSDQFEPGPVNMIGFDAPFRCWGVWDQDSEDALGNPHHALIHAHPDAELDDVPVRVPPGLWRKAEEHESLSLIGARR